MNSIYLDNAATTPVLPEVREALAPWLAEQFGNPSTRHPLGVAAADGLEDARRRIAHILGADLEGGARVVLTSGGTEANNLAVLGLARAATRTGGQCAGHVIVGPTEHPSVRAAAEALVAEGFELDTAPLTADGVLDLAALGELLRPDTMLVAQMVVNNEFGSIYPVEQLVRVVRANAPQARIHADCVQALGKLPLRLLSLGVDSFAISGHKVHAPKGMGALVLAPGIEPQPLIVGGGQEGGLRSGTENVAGAVALARAVELAVESQAATLELGAVLRGRLSETVDRIDGARLLEVDGGAGFVPTICSVLVPGAPAEVWQHHLETHSVYVGTGAACQAKKRELSPALSALGLSEDEARHVLRISFSSHTTEDELRRAGEALCAAAETLSALRS